MSEPLLRDTERAKLAEAMELLVTIARDIVRFIVRLLPRTNPRGLRVCVCLWRYLRHYRGVGRMGRRWGGTYTRCVAGRCPLGIRIY